MTDALSLYLPRPSWVHRLHPLTKLALAALPAVAGLALPGQWTPYAVLALGLLPLALLAQVSWQLGRAAGRAALPFLISILLVQGFFWPGGTPVWQIGPLSLKQEGLIFTATSTGRILVVLGSFLWFAFTTRPDFLMIAMTQRGLPLSLSYLIVATIQIIPRFQARAAAILEAQKARGLATEGGLLRRLRGLLPLVMPLILSSLIDVEERALAIEARAFNHPGPKTSLIEVSEATWEPAARWILALAAAGCALLGIGWRILALKP